MDNEDFDKRFKELDLETQKFLVKKALEENSRILSIEILTEPYEKLMSFKDILSKILVISKILKDKSLTEDKKEFYYQDREKLRRQLRCEPFYHLIKSLTDLRKKKKKEFDFSLK